MKLRNGSTAKLFSKKDIYGREVDLEKLRGKKILLSFFRNTACPFCNMRVHQLSKKYEEYKAKGLEMIFVFESKDKVILMSSFHKETSPIFLIGNPDRDLYKIYGIENSIMKMISTMMNGESRAVMAKAKELGLDKIKKGDNEKMDTIPADFLIDEDLKIVEAHYGNKVSDHLPLEKIEKFLNNKVFA
jgi:thioredoxin-dependent peroxiredoxin